MTSMVTHVAAIFGDSNDEDYFDTDDVMEGNEYVLNVLDLSHHLQWTCCVDAPSTCAHTPVEALIDHGCPPVLISSKLVEILSPIPKKLFKPMSVLGVFTKGEKKADSRLLLSHYCRLSVQLPNCLWKACVVNTVICPQLHRDLILGLDFLIRNHTVVDAKLQMAVAKESNYNLLNPPNPVLSRKETPVSPWQKQKEEWTELRVGQKLTWKLWLALHEELNALFEENPSGFDHTKNTSVGPCIIRAVWMCIAELATLAELQHLDQTFKEKYQDRFLTDISHVKDLPHDIYHSIQLHPGAPVSVAQAYGCPWKYWPGWKILIEQHLAAGRIRPSSSPYTSPSFIIPKMDLIVLPWWVNDYHHLNWLTTPDNYPLPQIDDILADCAKGKIWEKIDMTNSFFQMLINPDHIKYTATLTLFVLWKWVVMPMGIRNLPATHQQCITLALHELIGKICHVYLDNIIIWSLSLAQHKINVAMVLEALTKAHLVCSIKKSTLFESEMDFLGHHISTRGIEADSTKVTHILN